MLLSMTGYGKAEYCFSDHKTIVELRSVNSKQLDFTLKLAPIFRDKEADIRALLQKRLERGKVDLIITTQPLDGPIAAAAWAPINWDAVRFYINDYIAHAQSLSLPTADNSSSKQPVPAEVMAAILRFPDVLKQGAAQEAIEDDEWTLLQTALLQAATAFIDFRKQEGLSLQNMFTEKLDGIASLLDEVAPYETGRVEHIKQHLLDNLDKLAEKTKQAIDRNRLEQEMIYYLEKLDITEEKVRLVNHLQYFRETMRTADPDAIGAAGVGKKLGFIAQEMGREINTLGSKSNQSEMQIIVVKMKDILEQIKEQVLNVL